ncbi:MAG: hypothetical protein HPY55_07825 [Firmicutes bacterium]|nr:hypothetical protein [Bacillota bacterium]
MSSRRVCAADGSSAGAPRIREKFQAILHETLHAAKRVYGERLVSLLVFGSVGRV